MVERKAFFANPNHRYCIPQLGEHDCSAHKIKNGDYYKYRSLPHFMDEHSLQGKWWKESFSSKSKALIHVCQYEEHDCRADNKKNGDHYEYPSLSHFTNEL